MLPCSTCPAASVPCCANGQPALAGYQRGPDGVYRAHVIQALTCTADGIARITAFTEAGLFPAFGLPQELPL